MLVLLRHGQATANASGLLLGRSDVPLTRLGERQAEAAGAVLRGARRVVTSPLVRCRRTAEALGLPLTVDDRWIELDYGELDGTPLDEVPEELWRSWRSDLRYRPPGGESLAELDDRVCRACTELAEEARETDVVVVSHVSPIKAAVAWALGAEGAAVWRMFLAVASICRVAITPRGPVLHGFNDTSQLAALSAG